MSAAGTRRRPALVLAYDPWGPRRRYWIAVDLDKPASDPTRERIVSEGEAVELLAERSAGYRPAGLPDDMTRRRPMLPIMPGVDRRSFVVLDDAPVLWSDDESPVERV